MNVVKGNNQVWVSDDDVSFEVKVQSFENPKRLSNSWHKLNQFLAVLF